MTVKTVVATHQTFDATQENMYTSPTALTAGFQITIQAEKPSNGDKACWLVIAVRSDSNNTTLTGTVSVIQDTGASSWSIEVQEGTDALEINVTGQASSTINWSAWISITDFN